MIPDCLPSVREGNLNTTPFLTLYLKREFSAPDCNDTSYSQGDRSDGEGNVFNIHVESDKHCIFDKHQKARHMSGTLNFLSRVQQNERAMGVEQSECS